MYTAILEKSTVHYIGLLGLASNPPTKYVFMRLLAYWNLQCVMCFEFNRLKGYAFGFSVWVHWFLTAGTCGAIG